MNADIEGSASKWCANMLRHLLSQFNTTLSIPLNQYNAVVFLSVSTLPTRSVTLSLHIVLYTEALCTDFGNNWRKLLVPEF